MGPIQITEQPNTLLEEIEQYLTVVEWFRAEGIEPRFARDEARPHWWLEEWSTGALRVREDA